MSVTIDSTPVERDAEGFLTKLEQWNDAVAEQIAHESGIEELTPRHWLVVQRPHRAGHSRSCCP